MEADSQTKKSFTAEDMLKSAEMGYNLYIDIIKKKIEKLEGWSCRDALLIKKQLEILLNEIINDIPSEEPVPNRNQIKKCNPAKSTLRNNHKTTKYHF